MRATSTEKQQGAAYFLAVAAAIVRAGDEPRPVLQVDGSARGAPPPADRTAGRTGRRQTVSPQAQCARRCAVVHARDQARGPALRPSCRGFDALCPCRPIRGQGSRPDWSPAQLRSEIGRRTFCHTAGQRQEPIGSTLDPLLRRPVAGSGAAPPMPMPVPAARHGPMVPRLGHGSRSRTLPARSAMSGRMSGLRLT